MGRRLDHNEGIQPAPGATPRYLDPTSSPRHLPTQGCFGHEPGEDRHIPLENHWRFVPIAPIDGLPVGAHRWVLTVWVSKQAIFYRPTAHICWARKDHVALIRAGDVLCCTDVRTLN